MSALLAPWPLLCIGAYLLVATGLLWANHRLCRPPKTKVASYPPPVPPSVKWQEWMPPVPPTQADIDATWLDAWPTEARWAINTNAMEQERYDRLFDDLIAIEGLQ